jgi:DNA-binding NarL/FixJ family response regulator
MRVLVADDHSLFRDGLVSLLEASGFKVVGQAGDGQSAVEQTLKLHPDLVLLDMQMPVMNGLEALRQIKATSPETLVVILTVSEEENHLIEAVKAGANGYLLKHLSSKAFLDTLSGLQRGEAAITGKSVTVIMQNLASLSAQNAKQPPAVSLSEREIEILRLVAEGQSNAAISGKISLSENTVKYHLKNIMQKLNAHNRMEAVIIAVRDGLLKDISLR